VLKFGFVKILNNMLVPRKEKHRKQFRGKMRGLSYRGSDLAYGEFGLQALTVGWVSSKQIEAARKSITHHIKRGGKVWIKIFPHKPITKKPPETRMGSGKGDVYDHVAVVKPGKVLFELSGVPMIVAKEAFLRASAKLPIQTKFIEK
jgi:large subunit ribosomal protein L16